jgi:ATP-dependent Clp protease, protease subunit
MKIESIIQNFEGAAKFSGFSKPVISQYANKIIDNTVKNISTTVVEEAPNGSLISYDVYTRLLKDRVIFFGHQVSDEVTNVAISQLLFLEMNDPKKDITLYINSPGGSVISGLSLINVMDFITPDVSTIAVGMAASMGAVILTSGAKGKRFALRDTEVMIHQVLGGTEGQHSDMMIALKQMTKLRTRLYEILAETSGQTFDEIEKKCDRNYWMSAEEAKSEGFIDAVLLKRP